MRRPSARDLAIVLAASWVARALFVAAIGDAHSVDVEYWRGALEYQDTGRNPYESGVLNWPPLWLVVLVGLDAVANHVDLSLLAVLRVYLVLVESALVVTLYLTLVSAGVRREAVRRALLVGIALNPIAIILVCQHGNSDVQVGLLVTLTVAALLAHRRSRDVVHWLLACLLLGVGVLAKTVPFVLAPMLAPGARLASIAGRALGATLVVGPAALGVAVILALTPRAVIDHVIHYRSTRGFFGVSGILDEHFLGDLSGRFGSLTGIDARERYGTVFTLAVLVLVVWLARRLWHESPLPADRLFLLVAVILMVIVAAGPGYGPQYAYWFLPALVATYVLLDDGWRRLLLVGYAIAAVTYAVEYAFVPWLGAYASEIAGASDRVTRVSDYLDSPQHLTFFRAPLFAVYLVVVAAGVARLARPRPSGAQAEDGRVYDAKL
jgi:Glycosyltransferase family 87